MHTSSIIKDTRKNQVSAQLTKSTQPRASKATMMDLGPTAHLSPLYHKTDLFYMFTPLYIRNLRISNVDMQWCVAESSRLLNPTIKITNIAELVNKFKLPITYLNSYRICSSYNDDNFVWNVTRLSHKIYPERPTSGT